MSSSTSTDPRGGLPMRQKIREFCSPTRREFLWQLGGGFGAVVVSGLLDDRFFAAEPVAADRPSPSVNPLAPKPPHTTPKATSVIFLFMYGGPSHIDTFDYKPAMIGMDNKTVKVKTSGRGGQKSVGRIV